MEASLDDPSPVFYFLVSISNIPAVYYWINGLVLFMLLALSALISGSEVAFFSLTDEDIEQCSAGSTITERRVARLIQQPRHLLANILIFNNLVNVAIVTLATFISWEIVGSKSTEGKLVIILTSIITFCIVFFGEVMPKVYANQNSLSFAKKTSLLLHLSGFIFRPLTSLLTSMTSLIERRIERRGYSLSVDDLNQALEITTKENATKEEKEILKGIVNFGTLSVTQVMRSRMDITAFDVEIDFHILMDRINKCGFSRIPIYKETIDKIEGLLYTKDLLPYLENDEDFAWQALLRPAFFVPESKKVDELLKDFQHKRIHMAIVVDEYGGTSGLITLEDVIEEIVGEINDEFDDNDIAYNKLDENTFIFEGKTSLNDFCKIVDVPIDLFEAVKGESESLGGLLLEISNKLPRTGEKIVFENFVFTVVSVDHKRIKRIRVLIDLS